MFPSAMSAHLLNTSGNGDSIPEQPVPVLDHAVHELMFPKVQCSSFDGTGDRREWLGDAWDGGMHEANCRWGLNR